MAAGPRYLMAAACLLAGAWPVPAQPGDVDKDLANAWGSQASR